MLPFDSYNCDVFAISIAVRTFTYLFHILFFLTFVDCSFLAEPEGHLATIRDRWHVWDTSEHSLITVWHAWARLSSGFLPLFSTSCGHSCRQTLPLPALPPYMGISAKPFVFNKIQTVILYTLYIYIILLHLHVSRPRPGVPIRGVVFLVRNPSKPLKRNGLWLSSPCYSMTRP
jgi:hypothetical protein